MRHTSRKAIVNTEYRQLLFISCQCRRWIQGVGKSVIRFKKKVRINQLLMAVAFLIAITSTAFTELTQAAQELPIRGQGQGQDAVATYQLNLPKQTLAAALNTLSEQTDIQVLFPYDIAKSHSIKPMKGYYSIQQALQLMLQDTGLYGGLTESGVIAISQLDVNQNGKGKRMNIQTKKSLLATIIGLSAAAGGMQQAYGQDGEAATAQGRIDEIIVTATKRAETLQSVPIAITAFRDSDIQKLGAQDMRALTTMSPNVMFTDDGINDFRSTIAIRGAYNSVSSFGINSAVGVYLDGVYVGKSQAFNIDAGDLERVEVLRGPQGTLFGKNTTAGAINVITKAPGDEFEAYIEGEFGNLDSLRTRVGMNVPIVEDVFSARFSINRAKRDGYVTNLFDGGKLNNVDDFSARLQLLFTPGDKTSFRLSVDALESDFRRSTAELVTGGFANLERYEVDQDNDNKFEKENYGVSLIAEHELAAGYILTSVTGWRDDTASNLNFDADLTPLNLLSTVPTLNQTQISQELRLTSPLDEKFDYVLGAYFFDQTVDVSEKFNVGSDLGISGSVMYVDAIDIRNYAAFAHFNLHLTEQLTAFGGFRYTSESQKLEKIHAGDALIVGAFGIDTTPINIEIDADEPSWSIGLRHETTNEIMLYGSVSRGFKGGGFQTGLVFLGDSPDNLSVKPEFVTSYEVGAKTSWLDDRVIMNFAGFYLDYTDLQIVTTDTNGPVPLPVFQNAAKLNSKGVELEFLLRPTADLSLNVGVGYLDAAFDKFENTNDPFSGAIIDASGNRNALSPKWTYNFSVDHELPLANVGVLVTHLDYSYRSEYFPQSAVHNNPESLLAGYGVINGRVGIQAEDKDWNIYLWAKNITDKSALTNRAPGGFLFTGGTAESYTEPRTYGLTVRFNF